MTGMEISESRIRKALEHYAERTGHAFGPLRAALFDMDGVLFDSMPGHARAWSMMCRDNNIPAREEEFFQYEGRTGASTINILFRRTYGREATTEEIERLYGLKTRYFKAMPPVEVMQGAKETINLCSAAGIPTVLVTGSGQGSLLERLEAEFPGAFPPGRRVTGRDVLHGKPHPEPFVKGRIAAGEEIEPRQTAAVDNAPLGVESASASGAFTIGVRTGPIPPGLLSESGADIEINSMNECTKVLGLLLRI